MADYASESGHWYDKATGQPRYSVIGKTTGKERETTLADAKKAPKEYGEVWYPGGTTIIGIPRKPQLEEWKAEQVMLASEKLPRSQDESDDDWFKRVLKDADEKRAKAAARGTEIHAAIEAHYAGVIPADSCPVCFTGYGDTSRVCDNEWHNWPWVESAVGLINQTFDSQSWRPEKSFASPLGYGGKVDLHSDSVLLDFKGKEGDRSKWKTYDEHAMQLAAYARGLQDWPDRWASPDEFNWPTCGIIFFDRNEPYSEFHEVKPAELERGWAMFQALLAYWYAKTGLQR